MPADVPARRETTDALRKLMREYMILAINEADEDHAQELRNAAEAELAAIEAAVFTPSAWLCDKCGFREVRQVLSVLNGSVGAQVKNPGDRFVCPNDGHDLRRETWKERTADAVAAFDRLFDEKAAIERQREELRQDAEYTQAENTRLRTALENWGRHFDWCASRKQIESPCDCGLADQRQRSFMFDREWCLRMAKAEEAAGVTDVSAGFAARLSAPPAATEKP